MYKIGKNIKWFTLIEIIVSITIFSIIMVSIISIFILWSDLSWKIEINRNMQWNIKNVVETIAEDIRKHKVSWVSWDLTDLCDDTIPASTKFKTWTKLCTSLNTYFLAKDDGFSISRVSYANIETECSWIGDNCIIVKNDWIDTYPLTNSFVSVNKLEFYYSKDYIPKVTINIELRPSASKWVKSNLIENNIIKFQTTLSERLIESK